MVRVCGLRPGGKEIKNDGNIFNKHCISLFQEVFMQYATSMGLDDYKIFIFHINVKCLVLIF